LEEHLLISCRDFSPDLFSAIALGKSIFDLKADLILAKGEGNGCLSGPLFDCHLLRRPQCPSGAVGARLQAPEMRVKNKGEQGTATEIVLDKGCCNDEAQLSAFDAELRERTWPFLGGQTGLQRG
jgi:hypothetical protein